MLEIEIDSKKRLLIDKKRIGKVSSSGQISITLNKDFLEETGLAPGDVINIFYGNRKIIIVDDLREVLKELRGCELKELELENKKIIESSILEIGV